MGYTMSSGEIEFVKKSYEGSAAFLFVCGGFMVALQAGLPEGKIATAPRPMVEHLAKPIPK